MPTATPPHPHPPRSVSPRSVSPRAARRALAVTLPLLALAACAMPAPPPPPLPAVAVTIPLRPVPPNRAVERMNIPLSDLAGVRQTVNTQLTANQALWNLRSALNVAALNCPQPQRETALANYSAFLTRNAKQLSAANTAVTRDFEKRYGRQGARPAQDRYMTSVYNYFALPPTLASFCNTAVTVGTEAAALAPEALPLFSAQALNRLESVFIDFYGRYEQYRIASAQWEARYGPAAALDPEALAAAVAQAAAANVPPPPVLPTAGPILRPGMTTGTAAPATTPSAQPAAEPTSTPQN